MDMKTNSAGRAEIEARMRGIAQQLGRTVPIHPPPENTPEGHHSHLLEEAVQLYENELSWEEETGEESMENGVVVALVFPGTLALVDALLTSHALSDRGEGDTHRDVVASFLEWLSGRLLKLRSGQIRASATDRAKEADLTDRLIDLVLFRYCGLSPAEIEELDAHSN